MSTMHSKVDATVSIERETYHVLSTGLPRGLYLSVLGPLYLTVSQRLIVLRREGLTLTGNS